MKKRVYIDTNGIIEAFRLGFWGELCSRYSMETIQTCVDETQAGSSRDPRYVNVPLDQLVGGLAQIHRATRESILLLCDVDESFTYLDDGERDLLAFMHVAGGIAPGDVLLTADKAAIRAAWKLRWLDDLVSLERLARDAGVSPAKLKRIREQYREPWLSSIRARVMLGDGLL